MVSATSYESRCGGQVFAATGQYRNVVVRIKELKFSKKKDVTRDTMKEMRLLRDIRHDNVNSFIGAAVEPMRILIVTDYCAKGSLYVSILLDISIMLRFYSFKDNKVLVLLASKTIQVHKHVQQTTLI